MVLKNYIAESKAIRFEGDGYSREWRDEAFRRGLGNFGDTPRALDAFADDNTKALFVETGILSEDELEAHYDVRLEEYALKIQIESRTMAEMCVNQILPAAIMYQNTLIENILSLKELKLGEQTYRAQLELVEEISAHINSIKEYAYSMKLQREAANKLNSKDKAFAYCDKIIPLMEQLRSSADQLEPLVDDELWPLVKYREMLFVR